MSGVFGFLLSKQIASLSVSVRQPYRHFLQLALLVWILDRRDPVVDQARPAARQGPVNEDLVENELQEWTLQVLEAELTETAENAGDTQVVVHRSKCSNTVTFCKHRTFNHWMRRSIEDAIDKPYKSGIKCTINQQN